MLFKTSLPVLGCFLLFFSFRSTAQYSNYVEPMQDTRGSEGFNIYLGTNTFLGDLGGTKGMGKPYAKDFNPKTIRPFVGLSYTYFPDSWISAKLGVHYTRVAGADSLIKIKEGNAAGRFDRNLSFRSSVWEMSAEAELYPLQTLWNYREARWRPFIGLGVGMFYFNPKAKLNNTWYALKPLRLEGQGFAEYPERKNYSLIQPYLPLTFGLKYRLSNNYFLSMSGTFRKTFTDYIDDVATTFIDPNLFDKYLAPADATIAKQLYFRGTFDETSAPGPYRGYPSKDSYTSFFFTITYVFDNRYGYNYIGN